VFESSALLKYFRDKAEMQGGRNIVKTPILYGKFTAKGSVAGYGSMNINPNDVFTAAEYEWKMLYTTIPISYDEEDACSDSETAVMKMVEAKMKVAELTMADLASDVLFNDGSDTSYPHGLQKVCAIDRTLGGINSTTYPWWDANVISSTTNYTAANLVDPTSAYYILKVLRTLWNSCKHQKDWPDMIACSQGFEDLLEEEIGPYQRYVSDNKGAIKKANVDYADFTYKGKAPFVVDDKIPTETSSLLFMLNSNWLDFTIHTKRNFMLDKFIRPADKAAMVAQIFLKMQITCTAPRMQGILVANSDVG
jgi:hypothetical protein